jgi:hypothetical protein
MIMDPSRKFFWSVMLVVLALLLVRPTMNVAGFCWEENRFLSDEEFIFKALEETYSYYPPEYYAGLQGSSAGKVIKPIDYKSFEEFVSLNKDCCKLVAETSENYRVPWIYKTEGWSATMVEVIYRVETSEGAKSGRGNPAGYDVFFLISPIVVACGTISKPRVHACTHHP